MRRASRLVLSSLLSVTLIGTAALAQSAANTATRIAPQPLAQALSAFAKQTGLQLIYVSEVASGQDSNGAPAGLPLPEALKQLLEGTGLAFEFINDRTVRIYAPHVGRSVTAPTSLAQVEGGGGALSAQDQREKPADSASGRRTQSSEAQELPAPEETGKAIPEVLVLGGKSLNMDIRRSVDDPQPYVVLDRIAIERSGATNVDAFLKERLTSNTVGLSSNQTSASITGNASTINLRGLGANQTLILIDGHRVPNLNAGFVVSQANINGVPLAAIERIEVLPTTASGIYGGSATGGVVNIVLRRDYTGAETRVTYDNSFESDTSGLTVDMGAGFELGGGRTNILLAGAYSDANPLQYRERDFIMERQARVLANNPGFFLNASNPPLGAATNIRSTTSTLTLKDGTPLPSNITHVPAGYTGVASDGGAALVANAGTYNFDQPDTAQISEGGRRGITNSTTLKSGIATVRHEFLPYLDAFLEAAASESATSAWNGLATATTIFTLPATAPTSPFREDVRVTVPTIAGDANKGSTLEDLRLVGGVIARLPGTWTAGADYVWQRTRLDADFLPRLSVVETPQTPTAATAVRNGTLDVLRDPTLYDLSPYVHPVREFVEPPLNSTLKDATLRISGPVASLPSGTSITMSALLEYREFDLDAALNGFPQSNAAIYFPPRNQEVKSAYLEARFPLVSEANRIAGVRELEVQIAGRWDEYTTQGANTITTTLTAPPPQFALSTNTVNSVDPTVAMRYQPVPDLSLRASYGTGFLPPDVTQLASGNGTFPVSFIDPRRGNTSTTLPPASVTQFGNPDLEPENSESWSVGAILTPRFIRGLRLSVDYTRIDKTDNITTLTAQQLLDNEALFPDRVTRGANLPGDQPGWAGPVNAIDVTMLNIARAEVEVYDAQLDYTHETAAFGTFDFSLLGTVQTHYKTQLLPSQPLMENVGKTFLNPLTLKGNASLRWTFGHWTLGWSTNYFDGYELTNPTFILNQGSDRVSSQSYHDAFASYVFDRDEQGGWASGLLADTQISLGVRNVFDEEPPFDASLASRGYYSPFGDPRLSSYYLSFRKSFAR